jgi:uncharacterized protein (DUF1501 family)
MRCIECEEIELARVRDERPAQTMPIPHQALDGFPAGRSPSHLTRRRLMQWGAAGAASIYAAKELGWEQVWESVAAADASEDGKVLVLLYLAGGNDGLNVIVPSDPADYAAYVAARPEIHRDQGASTATRVGSKALPGPGGAQMAFSNVVVSKTGGGDNTDVNFGFDTLYGNGLGAAGSDLAIMPGVDALKYNLSHFDNSDIWFAASNDMNVKTGWLGRWIDKVGSPTNPLQAISIDTALSKAIRTAVNPVCAIPSLASLGFTTANGSYASPGGLTGTAAQVNSQMRELAGVPAGAQNAYLARSRGTYGTAVTTWERSQLAGAQVPPLAAYPTAGLLSPKLKLAAHLIGANLGTRVITIHWGGFDTHTAQLASQDKQLIELSRALGAFRADLAERGVEQRVATLVFSEFGRRVLESGTGTDAGTDHGAGGLMFAMGSGVRGGLASRWPGCKPGDLVPGSPANQGNLKVTTDYRSVYAAVLQEWLGDDDPAGVLGGGPINTLERGDGFTGRQLFV